MAIESIVRREYVVGIAVELVMEGSCQSPIEGTKDPTGLVTTHLDFGLSPESTIQSIWYTPIANITNLTFFDTLDVKSSGGAIILYHALNERHPTGLIRLAVYVAY